MSAVDSLINYSEEWKHNAPQSEEDEKFLCLIETIVQKYGNLVDGEIAACIDSKNMEIDTWNGWESDKTRLIVVV